MNRSFVAVARNTPNNCHTNGTHINSTNTLSTNIGAENNKHVKRPEIALSIIKESDIICFDVDSTVIQEEGIDELAKFCGKGSEVTRVTKEAMGGTMTFRDALNVRLNIIMPSVEQINDFIKLRPSTLTKGIKPFVKHLITENKQVYLISGGFDCLIKPVAAELNIPMSNVFANKLCFNKEGQYTHFDITQPTSKSGGKSEAISLIKEKNPSSVITMIGDGATDLEAVPPADFFIGFGGNVVRTEVFNKAQYFITDFDQLWSQ